jgi:phosphatidylglycerol---prolipoprotein diacylglyceryl transferase
MAPFLTFAFLGRHFAVASYSTMIYLAAVFIFGVGLWICGRRGLPFGRVLICLIAMAGAAIAGSRLLYAALHYSAYATDPLLLFQPGFNGFALFGGLLFATITSIIMSRLLGVNIIRFADSMAPALGCGIAIMKTGCFLAGCCAGVPTTLPWGVVFPKGSDTQLHQALDGIGLFGGATLPVHPTQLYELSAALIGAGIAAWLLRRQRWDGVAFLAFGLWFTSFRLLNYFPTYQPASTPVYFYPALYALIISICCLFLIHPQYLGYRPKSARLRPEKSGITT